jgi:antitoxin component YwqK of YwqJK toxin-antitoxin module
VVQEKICLQVNGKKDGTWVWFDVKGKKTDEQVYQNGTIASHKRF